MENNSGESFPQMKLDQEGGRILWETVRWTRFLAIAGIVGLVVCLAVVGLAGSALFAEISRVAPDVVGFGEFERVLIVIGVLVAAAIFAFLAYLLYRFSVLTRIGIDRRDQAAFTEGMRCLKIYFISNGILAILSLLTNLISLTKLF